MIDDNHAADDASYLLGFHISRATLRMKSSAAISDRCGLVILQEQYFMGFPRHIRFFNLFALPLPCCKRLEMIWCFLNMTSSFHCAFQ